MIDNSRLHIYRSGQPVAGKYVLYWMQQAQRSRYNHALEWAVEAAAACRLPCLVLFALTDQFPDANARHYAFMLEGLRDVAHALRKRGIAFAIKLGQPPDVVAEMAQDAALLVGDVGYLRIQRQWRKAVAERIKCPYTAVETDVVVPVSVVSDKEEYAARTIRPKINRLRPRYLYPVTQRPVAIPAPSAMSSAVIPALSSLALDHSVAPTHAFQGGEQAAQKRLARFIQDQLADYHVARNDPSNGVCSDMSPYLHFGHISPLDIALQIQRADVPVEAVDAYLEELIVRRELSMNFVHYQPLYDRYECVPAWALKSLERHRRDARDRCYSRDQLELAQTHDAYWNAAQQEMVITGKMHNYMRMYWGKKVIEWSASPEAAFETLLFLNNKYELDGRDANGFTGVAWCFGKHDRPWQERPIFGTVRYMAASGLKRKFNIDAYVQQIARIAGALG